MDIQNKRTIDKIMPLIQGWTIIILWYVPIFTRMGISEKDIKEHFKELIEAYEGEKIY
jgi:hypothetical protein